MVVGVQLIAAWEGDHDAHRFDDVRKFKFSVLISRLGFHLSQDGLPQLFQIWYEIRIDLSRRTEQTELDQNHPVGGVLIQKSRPRRVPKWIYYMLMHGIEISHVPSLDFEVFAIGTLILGIRVFWQKLIYVTFQIVLGLLQIIFEIASDSVLIKEKLISKQEIIALEIVTSSLRFAKTVEIQQNRSVTKLGL